MIIGKPYYREANDMFVLYAPVREQKDALKLDPAGFILSDSKETKIFVSEAEMQKYSVDRYKEKAVKA